MGRLHLAIGLLTCSLTAQAQDQRHIAEPVIPNACVALGAKLQTTKLLLAQQDEARPDTARIQQALDGCHAGEAVLLQAEGNAHAFLSGPLQLRAGVTLLIAKGAVLLASRDPRDYDVSPGSCGVVNEQGHGCRALINGDHVHHAAVMGEGLIDGRGDQKLLGRDVSWWDLANEAKVRKLNQNCPRLLVLSHCNDFTLYKITLKNSPNFHVSYSAGNGFTAWGVIIDTLNTGRNTDGLDPANAQNVTITHCFIHAGDDHVAIKAGGSAGPSRYMSIVHNHFYTGHGMSIGSETDAGADHILVSDLTIDGADNGIRIKSNSSRGGAVHDISYQDVCIRNTKNPIFMDSNYSFYGKERDKLPLVQQVTLRHVHIVDGGKITLDGYDASHRLQMKLDGVTVGNLRNLKLEATHAELSLGPGQVNFRPAGEDVQVSASIEEAKSDNSCEARFVAMPTLETK